MELLFILIVSAYLTRQAAQAVPDAIALAKGKPAPSLEKWKRKHPDKPVEPGARGYFGRMLTNAVEAWADRSSRKHRRRKMLQAARQEHDDSEWLRKKIARTDKRAARAERWAAKRGVIWDKTKAAATARRDENAAWDENDARDEAAAWDANDARDAGGASSSTANPAAAADETPGPPPGSSGAASPGPTSPPPPPPGSARGGPAGGATPSGAGHDHGGRSVYEGVRTPGEAPSGGGAFYEDTIQDSDPYRFGSGRLYDDQDRDPMWSPAPEPPASPSTVRAEGEIVRPHLLLESGSTTNTTTAAGTGADDILDAEIVEDSSAPAGNPAGNPTATTMEDTNMTASAEITNLPAAKAYTAKMTEYLNSVQSVVEAQKAELAKLAQDFGAELSDAELAMSSLQGQGFTGDPITQFQLANEQLAAMQQALSNAEQALNPLPDNATSAVGAYEKASEAFDRQAGIAENVQTQAATGNVANNTDFYANA